MQSQVPKLVVFTKGKPREIEMGQELTIGRGYSNLLRLEGDEISRVHAIIYRRNNDFIVRDLDSKNGVFVNGNKVSYAQLGPGDKLQVGKYKMVFDPPASGALQGAVLPGAGSADHSPGQALDLGEYTSSGHVVDLPEPPPLSPAGVHAKPTAPSNWWREEVVFLTREEWQNVDNSPDNEPRSNMARLRNAFFHHLPMHGMPGAASFVQVLLEAVVNAVSADRGAIIVRNQQSGDLTSAAMVADHGDVAVNRVVLRSGLEEGKAILCPRTEDSGLFRENDTVVKDKISSLISIPLGERLPFGILYVDRVGDNEEFDTADFQVMLELARLLELHLFELQSLSARKDAAK